jgi:hypothetical protein
VPGPRASPCLESLRAFVYAGKAREIADESLAGNLGRLAGTGKDFAGNFSRPAGPGEDLAGNPPVAADRPWRISYPPCILGGSPKSFGRRRSAVVPHP